MAPLPIHTERVLLVEDDADIRDTIVEVLEEDGFSTAPARTGAEALAHLVAADTMPQLILLDLMMPGMDGWQFAAEKRKNPAWAAIPVVVLSAAGNAQRQSEEIGAVGCLRKPVDLDDLLEWVSRFCGARPRAATPPGAREPSSP